MAKIEIELDSAGVRALLQSPEIQAVCVDRIRSVQAMCGEGYETDTFVGKTRVNAMLRAATPAAMADNAENHTIEKAIRSMK
jgi:hypothetical protein